MNAGPYVVAFDPSLSSTGVATAAETFTIRTKPDDPARLDVIYTAAEMVLTPRTSCDYAVIEDLPANAQSAGLTGMAQGVIRLALVRNQIPFAVVPPASLKKFATGKGNATKPDLRLELYKRTGIDLRDDNQVDAWWLRQIGLHLTGHPDAITLPKMHTDALLKVKTP
jgi:Holliday junction resolvasome RuvABC endonuclease subunit